MLRLRTIKVIVDSCSSKSLKSAEPRRVQVLDLYCLTRFESKGSSKECYNFSYFALFTYDFSLFLEVSHGAAALTHFSLIHIAATLLTHCTAVVLTHSIAILIALPHWCSIYSGQSCRLFLS